MLVFKGSWLPRKLRENQNFFPWFKIPWRKTKNVKILFGHWAALKGETNEQNFFALDTGCVYGKSLTAMRLEDGVKFQIRAVKVY